MAHWWILGGLLVSSATAFSMGAIAQEPVQACPEIQNTAEAILNPDKYAWLLFIELGAPADPSNKCADPTKNFGDEGPVVWETWRNVRNNAEDTVFRTDALDPGPWLGATTLIVRKETDFEPIPIKQLAAIPRLTILQGSEGAAAPLLDPVVGEGNEVRVTRATYEFIRSNRLYDRNQQKALAAAGEVNLIFPAGAKEIKAQWRRIREEDRPRYHWSSVETESGEREVWGLTALHITTKDLPNWFWATFEHIDNKQAGEPAGGGRPNLGWLTRSVDRFACPSPPHDCEAIPAGLGLEGTKWENYRLRGTQVDFIDTIGRPTILASSQIEAPFQQESSCITCHSMAAIDKDGVPLGFQIVKGPPDPNWFSDSGTGDRRFMQTDFVFTLGRARAGAAP